MRFGEHPFDDISANNPLAGTRVSRVPENELAHAAALSLLPEFERLWEHVVALDPHFKSVAGYASSCRRRLARVFLQHLRMERLGERGNTYSGAEELIDHVTLSFIHMVGAFDSLALLTRDLLGLDLKPGAVSWHSRNFRKLVKSKHPALASLLASDSKAAHTYAAIAKVRNTVHMAMPDPALSRDEGAPAEASIMFKSSAHSETIAAMDRAGWSRFVFNPDVHPASFRNARNVQIAGVLRAGEMLFIKPTRSSPWKWCSRWSFV